MNLKGRVPEPIDESRLDTADKWILGRLQSVIENVTELLENYDLSLASQRVYEFIWSEFCDWYIEMAKPRLYTAPKRKNVPRECARPLLKDGLKLLHPFIALCQRGHLQHIPGTRATSCLAPWPKANPAWRFEKDQQAMEDAMELVRAARNTRRDAGAPGANLPAAAACR